MKILFIGGNGNISWYCVEMALQYGHEVWELNRGQTLSTRRDIQPQVHRLIGDIRNIKQIEDILRNLHFDVVCDFICYNEMQAENAVKLFRGKIGQYIFISSESVYTRLSQYLPFKENTPQNMNTETGTYVYGKVEAEKVFRQAQKNGFPVTIVRPAYTYDTIVPAPIGQNCYTAIKKYEDGYPVLVPGDGSNLWTFTHARDFAKAFVQLIGNSATIGEDYHITSDEWLTWNDVADILKDVLKIPYTKTIHIPSDDVLKISFYKDKEILNQRLWHNIYDNTKIKSITNQWKAEIKFADGIYETICWLKEKPVRRRIVSDLERELNFLYAKYAIE